MADEQPRTVRFCIHCGSQRVLKLGLCEVCNEMVCDHCGNTQLAKGQRKAVHTTCLRRHDSEGFSMIKFVK